jgi:RNA polymerase sigma-70 factor (ECF subfamily)
VSSAPASEERQLIARAAAGDDDAFRCLVSAHRDRIHRLARLNLRDAEAAAEVAHHVFVRLHGALGRFRHEAALSTWLHRVTINLCRDAARRVRRARRFVALDEADHLPAGPDSDPELEAIRRASDRDVHAAIAALPDPLREIVALRFGSGLTHAEIAEVLGTPLGTICTRMQRALAHLAGTLRQSPRQESQS